ncbi:MAG: hypothetical protein R2716_02015 [Microthrixaceae bacterium]
MESQEQKIEEILECVAYFEGLWDERRGGSGFDLVTMLANGEATRDMATIEHLGNLLLLIVGGNDTTRNSMSGQRLHALNRFPDQYEMLIEDPGLVSNLVRGHPLADASVLHAPDREPRLRDRRQGECSQETRS